MPANRESNDCEVTTKYLRNVNLCLVNVKLSNIIYKYFIYGLNHPSLCSEVSTVINKDGDVIISFNNGSRLLFNTNARQMVVERSENLTFYEPTSPIEMIDEWLGGLAKPFIPLDHSHL